MTEVPFIVIEDTTYKKEWVTQYFLSSQEFSFWLNNKDYPICDGTTDYNIFLEKFKSLQGPALIVLDLGLDVSDFENSLYDKELRSFLPNYAADPRQKQGLYLFLKLIQNNNWYGVIEIATTLGHNTAIEDAIFQIKKKVSNRNERVFELIGKDAISTPCEHIVKQLVNEACSEFLERFGNIKNKLWPEYTKNWFDDKFANQKVPHDYRLIIDYTKKETCKKEVQKYLIDLLSPVKVPEAWFIEYQFPYLYNDLKGLVGSCSAFQGNQGDESYPKHCFTLGDLLIILATIDKSNSNNWLPSISWGGTNSEKTILPKQTYSQAMEVIDSIIDENKGIRKLILDKHSGNPLINQVILQGNRLKVILNLPFADKLKEKVLTLKSTESGGTYDFYKNFLITSGTTIFGRQAECAINLFSENNQTVLEVISCA